MNVSNTTVQGVDTIVIRVTDIARSRKWYEETLGIKLNWADDGAKMAVYSIGENHSLTLWQLGKNDLLTPQNYTGTFPVFQIESAELYHRFLADRNISVEAIVDMGFIKYFGVRDLDGNRFELCETIQNS